MARIVLVPAAVPSTVGSMAEMARRLGEAGHQPVLALPEDAHPPPGTDLSPHGGVVADVPTLDAAPWFYRGMPAELARRGAPRLPTRARTRAAVDAAGFERLAAALGDLRPDACIIDVELAEHVLASLELGVPVAGASIFVNPWRRRGVPPLDDPTVPSSGPAGDAAVAARWFRVLARRHLVWWRHRVRHGPIDRVAVMRRRAADKGVAARLDPNQWLMPGLFPGVPVLVMSGRELDLPHTPAADSVPVGPMLRQDRAQRRTLDGPVGDAVAEAHREGRRLVYCSFGTFEQSYGGDRLERIVAAAGERPHWQLVVGLGGVDRPVRVPLPPNVVIERRVPQLEVLEGADVAVTHAGTNTIHECLLTGTPLVSFPTVGLSDQLGNGARIAAHRVGVRPDPSLPASEMARVVDGVLDDPTVAARAGALGAHLAAYRTERVLEREVDRLLVPGGRGQGP